jgi:hypothetical protein
MKTPTLELTLSQKVQLMRVYPNFDLDEVEYRVETIPVDHSFYHEFGMREMIRTEIGHMEIRVENNWIELMKDSSPIELTDQQYEKIVNS